MKHMSIRLLSIGLVALSLLPLKAQTDTWTDGGADQAWSDTNNWSDALVPGVTPYGSSPQPPSTVGYNIVIGALTTSSTANPILLDTGSTSVGQTTISIGNLTFDNTTSVGFEDSGAGEVLVITGATGITNTTAGNQVFGIAVQAGANDTYSGGAAGGSLTFGDPFGGSLNIETFTITMTGAVTDIATEVISDSGSGVLNIGDGTTTSLVTLDGANTYAGGTNVKNAGTLVVGASSTISGGAITSGAVGSGLLTLATGGKVEDNGTAVSLANSVSLGGNITFASTGAGSLTFNGTALTVPATVTMTANTNLAVNNSTTIADVISGAFNLTQSGTGTLILSAANTFTGTASVTSGSLDLSNTLALQHNTLTTGGTGIIFDSSVGSHAFTIGGLSGSGNLALQDNAGTPNAVALTVGGNNGSTTYSGALSAAGSLIKTGTGVLTLSGPSTYTGGTTINGGEISVAADNNTGTGNLTLGGGELLATASFATGKTVTLNTGVDTLAAATGSTVTYSGAIGNGTGSAIVIGDSTNKGIVVFGTANTYTGSTSVTNGALEITNNGSLAGTSGVAVSSGAALQVAGGISTTAATPLTLNGTGLASSPKGALENVSGANTYSGLITLGSATTIGSDAGSLALSNVGTITGSGFGLTLTGTGNGSVASIIGTGAGTVTKSGTGKWTLTGANTFTGTTTISTGTLALSGTGSILNSGGVNLTSNTSVFDISAATVNPTINDLTGVTGSIVNLGANALQAGTGNSTIFAGVLEGTGGGFTKVGAGTLTLSGANTYTGGTDVFAGTLKLSGAGTLGATTATLAIASTGTLDLGATTQTVGALTLGSGGSTIASTGGAGTLNTSGVTVDGTGNTINSGVTVSGATTLTASSALAVNGTLSGATTIDTGATLSGAGTISGNTTLTGTGNINFTNPGNIVGTLGVTGGNWNGAGTVSGLVTSSSGTFAIGTGASLTASGGVNVTGGSLSLSSTGTLTTTTLSLSGASTLGSNTSSRINGSINDTSSATNAFAGVIANNGATPATVTVNNGAGTLELAGVNTYTGATTVTAGTLELFSTGSISSSPVSVAGGATLAAIGANSVGAITDSAGTITLQNGGINTLNGASLAGNGTLSIDIGAPGQSDELVLSGAFTGTAFTVNVDNLGSAATGTAYTFIAAGSGLSASDFTLGTVSGGSVAGDTGTFTLSGNTVTLTLLATAGYYYTGTGTNPGIFNETDNYYDSASGGTVETIALSGTSNVYIGATSPAPTTPISVAVGPSITINTLNFTTASGSGASVTGAGTLTINGGLTQQANVTGTTISAPVTLGANQSWTVATAGDTLTDSGGVNFGTNTWTIGSSGAVGTVILLGADTGTGAIVVSGGALNLQNNGALGTASSVSVTSGAALRLQGGITTTAATPLTLNGTGISGNGALESVSGVNTYTGLVTLGSNTTIGADNGSTLDLTNAGTITGSGFALTLTGAGDINVSSIIGTGTGGLIKAGSGIATLTGANTFTGATTINAGTLALGAGGSLADSSGVTLTASGAVFDITAAGNQAIQALSGVAGTNVNLGNNGLTVNETGTSTFAGVIGDTGGGSLTMAGTGTLTLSGANTYAGGTTINAGEISVSADNNTGTGNLTLGGGELLTTATFATTKTVTLNAGTDTLAAANTTTATYGGIISGGALTIGDASNTGTVLLTAANNYTGATSVNKGTLQIGNGTTGSIANGSAVTVATGATLAFDEVGGSTQSNTITDNGTVVGLEAAGSNTLSGVIGGTGGFTQTGAGTTILAGADNYGGATTVSAGTLQVGNGTTGSIANGSAVTVATGATLAFDEATGSTQSNAIADSGTVAGAQTAGTLTLSGIISGNGGFTQTGAGTTTLTAGNTYGGTTAVNAGTLQIGNGTTGSIANGSAVTVSGGAFLTFDEASGSTQSNAITDGGTVTTSQVGTFQLSGVISGGGGVTQSGAGGTILAGTDLYTGPTAVNAGTLQIGNGTTGSIAGASAVTVSGGATLNFDEASGSTQSNAITDGGTVAAVQAGTLTLSGIISGGGGFTQTGAGTTTLSGANSYAGSTTISSGRVNVTGAGTLGNGVGPLTLSGGSVLDLGGSVGVPVGAVQFTGPTTVQNGTLTGASYVSNTAGLVTLNANLAGTGAFNQSGAGTTILNGANTYSGGTSVSAGTLLVGNGSAFGTGLITQSGGNIGTTGTGGIAIAAPGGFTQTAGTLTLQLNGAPTGGLNPANDILNVTGSAALGGNLSVKFNFVPVKGDLFTVITTTTGISGGTGPGYATPISSPAGYQVTGSIINAGDDFQLDVISTQFALTAQLGGYYTPNRAAILNYIDNNVTSGPLFTVITAALAGGNLPATSADIADQFNPAKFANFVNTTVVNNAVFSTQLLDDYLASGRSANGDFMASKGMIDSSNLTVVDPSMDPGLAMMGSRLLAWSPAPLAHGMLSDSSSPVLGGVDMKSVTPAPSSIEGNNFNVFVAGNVVLAQTFSQPDLAHSNQTTGGVQIGADYRLTPHLRAGAMFTYNHTDGTLDTNNSKATLDSYAPGVYVSYAQDGWYANALGSYGFNNFTEDRNIGLGGFSAVAHGAPSGDQITGNLDGGYDFHLKNLTYGPLAGVQYTHLEVDSYTEDGADSLASDESVSKQQADSLRSRLGAHASYDFHAGKVTLTPHFEAAWQHEFMDSAQGLNATIISPATAGAAPFTVRTPNPSRDSALIDCGLNAELNGQVSVFGDYLLQAGQSDYFGQAVQAGVKIGF